jgi:hypothetical protein
MDFFGELAQEGRIHEARRLAARGEHRAEEAAETVAQLARRLDRLVLANAALWSLLKESTGLTDAALVERMASMDAEDGQVDGRLRVTLGLCPECGRALSQKHGRCLFCGHEPPMPDPFQGAVR